MNLFKSLFGAASASGAGSTSMNAQEAKARIDGEGAPYILDVRQADEYKSGHIPAAVLIPLDRLSAEMSKLPKDRDILCVCRSGSRSGSAVRMLNNAGYKAINLRGGMMSWQSAGFPVKRGK